MYTPFNPYTSNTVLLQAAGAASARTHNNLFTFIDECNSNEVIHSSRGLRVIKTRQTMYYNATLGCVRATTVAVEKQYVLHILSMCL